MISTRLYLDARKSKPGMPAPLKLAIFKNKVRALVPLDISLPPDKWDMRAQAAIRPYDHLNLLISQKSSYIRSLIFHWEMSGLTHDLKSSEIKDMILDNLFGKENVTSADAEDDQADNFSHRYRSFQLRHSGRTREIYAHTEKRIIAYIGEKAYRAMKFEDVTVKWLKGFDDFMASSSPSRNARNIHFRNIRAVFNDALDDEVISCYPFRKFKLRPVATRKRALSVEDLRIIFTMEVEPYAELYRDMFKLIFMLIGINTVDLYRLKAITREGRIEYERAKTHRLYSVKVEPEAYDIIERYKGKKGLLMIADRWHDHVEFRKKTNMALKKLGAERHGLGGKKGEGLYPEITTYWARHTWATVAASLDIPKETIAAALGHGGNTVTDIYIDFDQKKVDEANRRVLDWVLYGKK